jgi:4a-hydroxytetrahydrobiopterin dehydratase
MSEEIDLSKRKCVPCEGGIDAIDHNQASLLIKKLASGWILSNDSKKIYKDFKFKNHYEVMSAINLIAWISHREDHHPEITFSYNTARVIYYTYAIDGLSENDFICASKIDKAT